MTEHGTKKLYAELPKRLLPWFDQNARKLPWREDKDPYRVWVSEIMLQQTRVEAVKGYYARFLAALPDIAALSRMEENDLLKLWEGLGYYNRVRNMQKAARIMMESGGCFPDQYDKIRALPGIGDYTADAIGSICFNMKTPAVDGNVLRVVSRLLMMDACIDDAKVKTEVRGALREICPADAGKFTQALMELGATVCLPNGAPNCAACPLAPVCRARRAGTMLDYPVRKEKKKRRIAVLTVFLLRLDDGRIAMRKRPADGLLAGMYELHNTAC